MLFVTAIIGASDEHSTSLVGPLTYFAVEIGLTVTPISPVIPLEGKARPTISAYFELQIYGAKSPRANMLLDSW